MDDVVRTSRSAWASEEEPCHQKLSMDMWTFMKAGASPPDADAQHVYDECMRQPDMGLVELITPEVFVHNEAARGTRMHPKHASVALSSVNTLLGYTVEPFLSDHTVFNFSQQNMRTQESSPIGARRGGGT